MRTFGQGLPEISCSRKIKSPPASFCLWSRDKSSSRPAVAAGHARRYAAKQRKVSRTRVIATYRKRERACNQGRDVKKSLSQAGELMLN
jgi:hypothetical protein